MKLIDVDKLKEVLHNDKQLSSYNGIPKEVYDRLINTLLIMPRVVFLMERLNKRGCFNLG